MNASRQSGFTLIELMIVVAIIGILAAIAVPQYQNYIYRARVTEGLTLAGAYKTAVAEYYSVNQTFPSDVASVGLSVMSSAQTVGVDSIQLVPGGVISIIFRTTVAPAGANEIQLTPASSASGGITWSCGGNLQTNLKPRSCI